MTSAFVLSLSAPSASVAWVTGVLVGVLGLLWHGTPELRFVITVFSGLHFTVALFQEDVPMEAGVKDDVVAVLSSACSAVPPRAASFRTHS